MSIDHLLSLAELHAAAPGILDVVFGPDGDVEGAPNFSGPIKLQDGRYVPIEWLLRQPWDRETMYQAAALDLRVPSVSARLAGLCAKVLDIDAVGPAWVSDVGQIEPEFWVIRYANRTGYASHIGWSMETGQVRRRGLTAPPPNVPSVVEGLPNAASFLRALTLALAPRIAALGGAKGEAPTAQEVLRG